MLLGLLAFALAGSPLSGALSDAERKAAIAKSTPEELEQAMKETPVPMLLEMGTRAVDALGTYSYRMKKSERINGAMHEEQEIVTTIREKPFAARLEFINGPGKGRRVLFNSEIRKRDFRVKEPGFLKIFGGLWIDVDSSLAKKDSNHTILEAGLGNLLRRFKRDHDRAVPLGGFAVKHEGWNAKGSFCSIWVSPNKGVGFDSASTRICTDLKTGLPSKVESYDVKGTLIETYEFYDAKKVTLSDAFLKPEGL
jgi:hypothetical protein